MGARRVIFGFVFIVFLTLDFHAQPPEQLKRASALFNAAVEKYGKGQYDAAIADYTEYLKLRPTVAAGWFNRGIAYKQKADAALSQADYRKAVADFTQAIKLDPKDKDYYLNRAKAHSVLLRVDFNASLAAAVADYSEAIKLDTNFAAAYSGRGQVYEDSNQQDKAFADLNRAIQLNPNDAVAHYTRAKIYSYRKNYTAARADLETALRLYPGYEQAMSYLSYVDNEARKPSTPVAATQASPSPPVITSSGAGGSALDESFRRTEEAEKARNHSQVVALATRTLELIPMIGDSLPKVDFETPLYIGTLRMRAKALSATGKHAESDRDFKEAGMASLRNVNRFIESATATLQRDKYGSPAVWVLAEVEVFKGVLACRSGVEGAKEWDAAVQRSRPSDMSATLVSAFMVAGVRESCALALINLGDYRAGKDSEAAKRTKQLNEALAFYNEAVLLSPRDPRVYQGRAKIYRKLGRIDLALADEKKASELPAKK